MMNYLKKFESFQTQDEIHKICKQYKITNYTINSDGSIDVDGDVKLGREYLTRLPLKFNKVSGIFNCASNNLTTLKGAPKSVDDEFNCSYNQLTTLEGSPQFVGNIFTCFKNKLTTLKGGPQSVGSYFDCSYNQLTTLEGSPKSINGRFNCSHNRLTTLEGGPQFVTGNFNCSDNNLTTLEGAPQSVKGFFCISNRYLKSLEYLPKYIRDKVYFTDTTVYEIFKLFDDYSTSMIRYINDFKVIEDDKINLEMLNALLYDHGKPPVENVEGYDNIYISE